MRSSTISLHHCICKGSDECKLMYIKMNKKQQIKLPTYNVKGRPAMATPMTGIVAVACMYISYFFAISSSVM